MHQQRAYQLYLLPAIVLSVVLVALPILCLLALSVLRWNPTESRAIHYVGLANYVRMLHDGEFLTAFWRTLLFTAESVALQVVAGTGIAVLFNRAWPGMGLMRALLLTPMMIAPLFVGMIWRLAYSPDYGIIKYLFSLVGVYAPPLWLANPVIAFHAVVAVNIWEWTPFVMLFLLAGLQAIPPAVTEAAALDGATRWRTFWSVVLPLLQPVLLLVVLFRTIDTLKVFDIIFAMTRGGPGAATETVSYLLYQETVNFYELGYSATLALVVLVVIMALSAMLLRASSRPEGAE